MSVKLDGLNTGLSETPITQLVNNCILRDDAPTDSEMVTGEGPLRGRGPLDVTSEMLRFSSFSSEMSLRSDVSAGLGGRHQSLIG